MVLADPHQPDLAIVHVAKRFTKQTGYGFSAAVGRNCRFLLGEVTELAAVDQIRWAAEERKYSTVGLVNYHANGTLFHAVF